MTAWLSLTLSATADGTKVSYRCTPPFAETNHDIFPGTWLCWSQSESKDGTQRNKKNHVCSTNV